jgi:hypothetical protein
MAARRKTRHSVSWELTLCLAGSAAAEDVDGEPLSQKSTWQYPCLLREAKFLLVDVADGFARCETSPEDFPVPTDLGWPIPPDFLWGLVESPNLMRLSSKKAAHATTGGAAYRNPGI